MFIVMGATGNVGAAVADELLARGVDVTILTRHPENAGAWADKGAIVARADADNQASLAEAFRRGERAFLLNPPANPAGDTNAAELRTIANILGAVNDSGLEKVLAASTYGAQSGNAIGDLSTLWCLEEGLRAQSVPAAINRGAYYMTNWLGFTETVRKTGTLPSMYPADMEMPMVAPADLGRAAAERLLSPVDDTKVHYVEGPSRYTPQDVADAFAKALGREVVVDVAPRSTWQSIYEGTGFSAEAAASYTRMTAAGLDTGFDAPAAPVRGRTDLEFFITTAVNTSAKG